jgi:hypothetical protein
LRSSLNKGLSPELSEAFPNIVPIARPVYTFNGIPDPYWVSGFVSGDSTFSVSIENSSSNSVGKRIRLIFGTCLHTRDKELLIGMSNYFNDLELNLSNRYLDNDKQKFIYDSDVRITSLLQIKNFSDIVNKVIPFFNKYPVMGIKSLDFADFQRIAEIMREKRHLTDEGLKEITEIVSTMNLDRDYLSSEIIFHQRDDLK